MNNYICVMLCFIIAFSINFTTAEMLREKYKRLVCTELEYVYENWYCIEWNIIKLKFK